MLINDLMFDSKVLENEVELLSPCCMAFMVLVETLGSPPVDAIYACTECDREWRKSEMTNHYVEAFGDK